MVAGDVVVLAAEVVLASERARAALATVRGLRVDLAKDESPRTYRTRRDAFGGLPSETRRGAEFRFSKAFGIRLLERGIASRKSKIPVTPNPIP